MLTAAAFLLAYLTGFVLAFLRHPIYGLVTYVGVFYVNPPERWWSYALPSLRWSFIAAGVTVLAMFVHRRSENDNTRRLNPSLMGGLLVFLGWLGVQSLWALNPIMHSDLITMTAKYMLVLVMICKCIDSTTHLKYFLWTHAAGCFYLGIIVFTTYSGGRFEGFGTAGASAANEASLLVTSGIIVLFALFLSGKWREKAAAAGFMPFTLNILVATISRSGFLALGVGGVLFNLFAPKYNRRTIRTLSFIGIGLFALLTTPTYWDRIESILAAGEEIEGQDTGSGRLVIMQAQLRMFAKHPLGCGHRCTATLSSRYLDDSHLTGTGEHRARSSHNTYLTVLLEQGIPGVVLFLLLLFWIARRVFGLLGPMRNSSGLLPNTYAATVAILGAIAVGDMFVDYLKFEPRVWFIGMLVVLEKLHSEHQNNTTS